MTHDLEDFDEVMDDIKESIINEKLEQLISQLELEDKFEQLSTFDNA